MIPKNIVFFGIDMGKKLYLKMISEKPRFTQNVDIFQYMGKKRLIIYIIILKYTDLGTKMIFSKWS